MTTSDGCRTKWFWPKALSLSVLTPPGKTVLLASPSREGRSPYTKISWLWWRGIPGRPREAREAAKRGLSGINRVHNEAS